MIGCANSSEAFRGVKGDAFEPVAGAPAREPPFASLVTLGGVYSRRHTVLFCVNDRAIHERVAGRRLLIICSSSGNGSRGSGRRVDAYGHLLSSSKHDPKKSFVRSPAFPPAIGLFESERFARFIVVSIIRARSRRCSSARSKSIEN